MIIEICFDGGTEKQRDGSNHGAVKLGRGLLQGQGDRPEGAWEARLGGSKFGEKLDS